MTVLKTYPSSSGSAVHEVRRGADGKVYCTCMGWKTSKADPKMCKHLRAYAGDAGAVESVRPPKPKPVGAPEAMLAHQVEKAPREPWGDERWVMENKYDGWRLFLAVDEAGRQVQYARSGLVHDEEWLRDLPLPPGTVLDGEVTSPGVASQYATGTRERLVYAVFDVLQAAGMDFRGQPWDVRRQALEQVVQSLACQYVVPSQVFGTPNQAAAEWLMRAGAEGVMLKRRSSVYESGKRSWSWLKAKCLAGNMPIYCRVDGIPRCTKVARLVGSTNVALPGRDGEWRRVVRLDRVGLVRTLTLTLRNGFKLKVSPEHRFPTSRGLLSAAQMRKGDVIESSQLPDEMGSELGSYRNGWVVGFFVADGSFESRHRVGARFALGLRDEEAAARISDFVERFVGSLRRFQYANKKMIILTVSGEAAVGVLRQYVAVTAHGKHLSQACWFESSEFLRGVLDGYLAGDGYDDRRFKRWRLGFSARNHELLADLRTVCSRLGVSMRARRIDVKDQTGKQHRAYQGEVHFQGRHGRWRNLSDFEVRRIQVTKSVVYEIEVDGDHLFVLPDGTVTHNSQHTYDVVIVDMEAEPTSEERKRWGWKNLRYGLMIDGRLQVVGTLGVTGPPEELAPYVGRVCEVKGYGQSETTGAIRHPQFLKLRDAGDKLPEECILERSRAA